MKRFEYRLQRVLELRKQQAEGEKARLQGFKLALDRLDSQCTFASKEKQDARAYVKHAPSTSGEDLAALGMFERHIERRIAAIQKQKDQLNQQIVQQVTRLREADRKVKLLENLKSRRLAEWTLANDKELEELAADSFVSRILAGRRSERDRKLLT